MPQKTLDVIKEERIISIMRGVPSDCVFPTIQALYDGGIKCFEITINHSSEEARGSSFTDIKKATDKYGDKMYIGVGTVLTPEEVEKSAAAGAQYIISPNANEKVIKRTKELGLISLPGAMTPTEIVNAYSWGADIIKVFPAGDLGPKYFKSLSGPLGYIPVMAVGGVNLDNLADFFKAGAMGAGIGGNLANVKLIQTGNFSAITATAKTYVQIAQKK